MTCRGRTTICPEGCYYLLLLALVFAWTMLREENLLLAVAGMLSGPVVLSWWLAAATTRGLEVERQAPRGIRAGQEITVFIDVSNTRKRLASWAVVAEEQVAREDDSRRSLSIRPTVFFPHVPAGRSERRAYHGHLPQRGRYRLGPLRISSRFPFGLFRRTIVFEAADTLTVYPRLGRLTPGWAMRRREAFQGSQRGERRSSRLSAEFFGVREWRAGDSLRWIHWRSFARHGNLVVRQFEQHRNRDTAVLVDLWQPDEPGAEDLENVELAVSFAATVVADVCRRGGSHLWLGIAGIEPQCAGGPASAALTEEAMRRLAVAGTSSRDHLPDVIELALGQVSPDADVVLVGTRSVDLADETRFALLERRPGWQAMARRIYVINAADGRLADYFQPE